MRANNPVLVPDDILATAFKEPDGPMGPLSKFIFYSKYSRWRDDVKRREYWAETVQRSSEYNINLGIAHAESLGIDSKAMRDMHMSDLLLLFYNQYNLRQFLSGRTLWTGGTPASYLYPLSNFNCSFMVIDHWHKYAELCYLGMVGAGIGFRILPSDVAKLAPIVSPRWDIEHEPINTKPAGDRSPDTSIEAISPHEARIVIGDSKEGWVHSIKEFFDILTGPHYDLRKIRFNYDNIRPKGERIKIFGGTAGGPHSIMGMYDKIHKILHGTLVPGYAGLDCDISDTSSRWRIRPIHGLDIGNAIADNIVSGGVRSFAEIGLGGPDDEEFIQAKVDHWKHPELAHRNTSNNSIFYESRPSDEKIDWQFDALRYGGEPCFVNAEVARRRRPNFQGVNPCVEILLDDRGVCNLTTVNVTAFVVDGKLNEGALFAAQALSARSGLRMTLPHMELPAWDAIQQRDRLLGVSMTGFMDAMDAVGYGEARQRELLREMRNVAREAADEYADVMGVNRPLLITTVKPEGTQSQLAGGVSSGVHVSHDTDYLRRVRTPTIHPMARAVFDLGWRMHADSNDGSWHTQVADLVQYLTWFDQGTIRVKSYTYHMSKLSMEFRVMVLQKFDYDQMKSMLGAYYHGYDYSWDVEICPDGDSVVNIEVTNPTFDVAFGSTKKVTVDFPISTPARSTKYNTSAIQQLETYRMFLHDYVDHNASNTISVFPHEWDSVKQWVKDNWDDMLAVSFLGMTDSHYPQQPYESAPLSEVEWLRETMADFDPDILRKYDNGDDIEDGEAGCEKGACPVR